MHFIRVLKSEKKLNLNGQKYVVSDIVELVKAEEEKEDWGF